MNETPTPRPVPVTRYQIATNPRAVVGVAWDPYSESHKPVIGLEYSDSPGYYDMRALDGSASFRARPRASDDLAEIPRRLALVMLERITSGRLARGHYQDEPERKKKP